MVSGKQTGTTADAPGSTRLPGFGLPPLHVALITLALATRLGFWAYTGATTEDAYISLRYAENLAGGLGLVFNPGERVFGASTPAYVCLLALLTRLGLPALFTAKVLAIVADGASLLLALRRLQPGPSTSSAGSAATAFAVLFALHPTLVQVSTSGMETPFFLLSLMLALSARTEAGLGSALGLACLIRPDGLLAAAMLLLSRWISSRVFPTRASLIAASMLLPWLVFATASFGSPLPQSVPAKLAAYNIHRSGTLPNLRPVLSMLAPIDGPAGRQLAMIGFLPLLACGILGSLRRSPAAAAYPPAVTLFSAWFAYLGLTKTFLFQWYYPPLILTACLLAGRGWAGWPQHTRPGYPLRAAAGLCFMFGSLMWIGWSAGNARSTQRAEWQVRAALGRWLKANTPDNALVALEPLGYIGYFSRRRMIDTVGLVTPGMVEINRAGAGWFTRMIERYRPDYVVERPVYLDRNAAILSGVPYFGRTVERETFDQTYEPVREFKPGPLRETLRADYYFRVYRRRSTQGPKVSGEPTPPAGTVRPR